MTARRERESMDKYRERRADEKIATKQRMKGKLIWNSHAKGTYIRAKHGEIGGRANG